MNILNFPHQRPRLQKRPVRNNCPSQPPVPNTFPSPTLPPPLGAKNTLCCTLHYYALRTCTGDPCPPCSMSIDMTASLFGAGLSIKDWQTRWNEHSNCSRIVLSNFQRSHPKIQHACPSALPMCPPVLYTWEWGQSTAHSFKHSQIAGASVVQVHRDCRD